MKKTRLPKINRILILGSSITALALARTAVRRGFYTMVADVRQGVAMHSRYPERLILPETDPEAVLERLRSAVAGLPTFCIADSDEWLRFIVNYQDDVKSIFADVLHPNLETLEICLDKNKFLGWCKSKGFRAPERYAICESGGISANAIFPLLLRPERTQHGNSKGLPKALEIRNKDELRTWIERFRELDVEPSVCESLLHQGIRQYSVGFARRRDGRTWMTVAEKIRSFPDQCAGGTYVVSLPQPEVEAFALRVVDALAFYGFGEAEVMTDVNTGKHYIIEINARPWVQFSLAERIRPGMFKFLVDRYPPEDGKTTPPDPNARWLHFASDLFICFSRSGGIVRNGRIDALSYLASIARANTFAIFDPCDLGPFFHDARKFARMILRGIGMGEKRT